MYTALVRPRVFPAILIVTLVCAVVLTAQEMPPPVVENQETQPDFGAWLDAVRAEALTRGIRQDIVDQALGGIDQTLPVVLERDRAQAESVLPLETYISRRVTPAIVRTGRQMMERHRTVLGRVSEAYGVPASVIVSIWGLESNFGRFTGVRPTIAALVTLAWDPRRSTFFRGELFNALEILNRGDIELTSMRGSWAGAMGQPQFMPSSYLQYAVDFDKDGRRDIWRSYSDIFASVANYLKSYGWVTGNRWGREASLGADVVTSAAALGRREGDCGAKRNMTVRLPLDEWRRLGVKVPGGGSLPSAPFEASLVSGASRHFLVYDNYDVILGYNCAHAYALSVAILADRLG
jgi:membrane-bound lytic murein transglycosylase B